MRGRGHFRGKPGREQQHTQAYRGTRYRASKPQIRRERRVARSLTSQASADLLCVKIKGTNREVSEGELISDHGLFLPTRANKEPPVVFRRDAWGFRRRDAGSRAGFISSRALPLWTSVLQLSLYCRTRPSET